MPAQGSGHSRPARRRYLRVHGKGSKLRHVPLHPGSAERIHAYLQAAGHGQTPDAPLFQPTRSKLGKASDKGITADGVYKCVLAYAVQAKISIAGLSVHNLRATAATNALDHEADTAKVQEWLGHANIATRRLNDRRRSRPEDSPTFKVVY